MTPAERRKLERKWKGNEGKRSKSHIPIDSPELAALGIKPQPVVKFSGVRCSFCGKDTPRCTASFGVAKPRKVLGLDLEPKQYGDTLYPVVAHIGEKVTACPDCAGNIKPLTNRDGEIVVMNCSTVSLD